MITTLEEVRQAMMTKFGEIPGVTVPADPLPEVIPDKTIMIFPRMGPSQVEGRGRDRQLSVTLQKVVDLEYHRVIPYTAIGSVISDITVMHDLITRKAWGEFSYGGSKFNGTVRSIEGVGLMHFGALIWNEWTFGIRMEISFTYEDLI